MLGEAGQAAIEGGAGVTDSAVSADADEADDAESYEPGVALALLDEEGGFDAASQRIAAMSEFAGASISQVTDDCVKIALPDGLAVEEAASLLEGIDGVASAQPNYVYHMLDDSAATASALTAATAGLSAADSSTVSTQAAANDPKRSRQWALASMNVPTAWDTVTNLGASNKSVSVAVIDSGFLTSHEDLKNVVVAKYNAATGGTTVYDNAKYTSHGTHVAGIIGAQANNGTGIAGVAYNTSSFATCKVVAIRVAGINGLIYSDKLVKAYSWLRKKRSNYNIRVANMSLGGGRNEGKHSTDYALERQINAAWDDGIVTVAAAGNIEDGRYNEAFEVWPSDSSNVVSVINLKESSNSDGVAREQSSNFNTSGQISKDVSAPGTNILSAYSDSTSSYETTTGTSMAAPAVAGVLALEFKADSKLTAPEAVSKLFSTTKDLTKASGTSAGWDRVTGFGEVNAAAAVATTAAYLSGSPNMSAGRYSQLGVKVGGKSQDARAWQWSSSNTSVARVSATGCVTGVAAGEAIITATNGSQVARQVVAITGSSTHVSSLSIGVSGCTYTGKARKPNPVVRDGSVKLVKGRDYKVSYSNNKKVGRASVKVTGIGSYYGSTTRYFSIKPKATSITSLKRVKKGFVVKWKKRSKQTGGYQVQIALDDRFTVGKRTFRAAGSRASRVKVGGLAAKQRYHVRVRTYKRVAGVTYYSSWSKAKRITM